MRDSCAKFIAEGRPDQAILDGLRDVYHNQVLTSAELRATPGNTTDSLVSTRNDSRVTELLQLLPRGFSPQSVLDFGCAEGAQNTQESQYIARYMI